MPKVRHVLSVRDNEDDFPIWYMDALSDILWSNWATFVLFRCVSKGIYIFTEWNEICKIWNSVDSINGPFCLLSIIRLIFEMAHRCCLQPSHRGNFHYLGIAIHRFYASYKNFADYAPLRKKKRLMNYILITCCLWCGAVGIGCLTQKLHTEIN